MKKGIIVFTALSVLVTSCTSKYMIPNEQALQDPEKYKIKAVTTVDGEVIEFREGVSIQHGRVVGYSKDGTLKRIPLSEVKWIRSYGSRTNTVKSVLVVVGICLLVLTLNGIVFALGESYSN
ncbi:hypothetical protein KAX08_05025 [candidate division WOR-3 bacterium]|nr:hypothetical protein [candidate division WOR-3 bacterium]